MLYSLGLDLKPLYLLIHSLYVFAEERQAFADGLAGVQREFDDEVVKEREGELVRCFNDDPAYVAYEEGKTYRLTHEWFFCPGAGWDLMPDHEGMREFHLSLAAQGQAASTPLTEPQRRTFDFNACLLLGPDQQDLPIVHPILLTRYLEGLTGVLYPGQYKTHAENAAYSVGEESRQFLGGESSGMDAFTLGQVAMILCSQRGARRSTKACSGCRWRRTPPSATRRSASRRSTRTRPDASSARSTRASSP
ncbi:MAG: hypothetical protein FD142_3211 [bacterium]|nr:MAG: hypothetical protein FD142_3211 [bacterium]